MKTRTKLILLFPLLLLLFAPSALAIGESSTVEYSVKPLSKKFSAKKYFPASLRWGVSVAPAEGAVTILPMREAVMQFPGSSIMKFQPSKNLRACRRSQPELVGPAELIYQRCPNSIIGNGEATFQLGQSTSPLAFRKGTVVILYGGLVGKSARLIFAAWSGDTNAGVVAEGVLFQNGKMKVELPVLTADSAVTSLKLSIPGKAVSGTWASGAPYKLRAGSDYGFVRVKCRAGQKLSFSSSLLLGARKTDGYPYGPTQQLYPKTSSRCGF